MSDVIAILNRCRTAGLRLSSDGDRIGIRPAKLCPPGLLAEIRAHKAALLELLQGGLAQLRPEEIPWLHIARQVVEREFDDADRSMLGSLLIGVRSINHPDCRKARNRLEALLGMEKPKTTEPRGLDR